MKDRAALVVLRDGCPQNHKLLTKDAMHFFIRSN